VMLLRESAVRRSLPIGDAANDPPLPPPPAEQEGVITDAAQADPHRSPEGLTRR
jgi:hypothetical protein